MALGTITIKNRNGLPTAFGDGYFVVCTIVGPNPYTTGGDALTAATLGFPSGNVLTFVSCPCVSGYIGEFDYTNNKLKFYDQKDPAAAGGADIPLPEVGAIDLSAYTFRVLAFATVV